MGEQFNILLNQMLMFFTLIIIGFVAQKVKLLVNETIDGLSKLVVRLILPLMVFTTVVNGATISGIAQKFPFVTNKYEKTRSIFQLLANSFHTLILFGIVLLFIQHFLAPGDDDRRCGIPHDIQRSDQHFNRPVDRQDQRIRQ